MRDGAFELWGRVLDREAVPLLAFAALLATAWWFAVLAALCALTRIRDVEPESAGLELHADHSPALAAMLVHRWQVPRAAAAATVVDLAARGLFRFERTALDQYTIAMGSTEPGELTPYERRVHELVRRRTDGTAIPLQALAADDSHGLDASQVLDVQRLLGGASLATLRSFADVRRGGGFFEAFAAEVVQEARQRGFSKRRWNLGATTLMALLAAPPGFLLGALFLALPADSTEGAPGSILLWTTAASVTALMAVFGRQRAERQTAVGMAAAGRWLGLRDNLRSTGSFADLPPTAIAVWDRLLPYAVGLGVAAGIAHQLPLEPESPTEAWSRETGAWRLVRIRYHARGRPGWGVAPWRIAVTGLLGLALAATGLIAVPRWLTDLSDRLDDSSATTARVHDALSVAFLVAVVLFGIAVVVSARRAAAGLVDLRRTRTFEGTLLRNRPPWLAVDDGTDEDLRAFNAPLLAATPGFHELEPGARVRMTISPAVGYARAIQRLGDPVVSPSIDEAAPIPPPPA